MKKLSFAFDTLIDRKSILITLTYRYGNFNLGNVCYVTIVLLEEKILL